MCDCASAVDATPRERASHGRWLWIIVRCRGTEGLGGAVGRGLEIDYEGRVEQAGASQGEAKREWRTAVGWRGWWWWREREEVQGENDGSVVVSSTRRLSLIPTVPRVPSAYVSVSVARRWQVTGCPPASAGERPLARLSVGRDCVRAPAYPLPVLKLAPHSRPIFWAYAPPHCSLRRARRQRPCVVRAPRPGVGSEGLPRRRAVSALYI